MLPERLPIELRGGGLSESSSVCAPPAGTSIVAGASRPGALTVQVPAPPPASLSSSERVSRVAGPQEPERDAGGLREEARRVGRLHVDHAAARGEHARRVLVRGVVEDGPRRQHERRLDLRGRPGRMALAQQRRRAGDRGRRHARARPGAVAARDRRDDVDAGRRDVGLERERVRRGAARRERRDQARVGRDLLARDVVDRERELAAGGGRLLREARADQVGHGQRALLVVGDRGRIARGALRVDDAERARGDGRVGARRRAVRPELDEHERAGAPAAAVRRRRPAGRRPSRRRGSGRARRSRRRRPRGRRAPRPARARRA